MGTKPVEDRISIPEIKYPEGFTLWRTEIDDHEKVQIINPEGFPKDEILDGMGIYGHKLARSFGICDREEIAHRHQMMRLLMSDQTLAAMIRDVKVPDQLPQAEQKFTEYFNPEYQHNPFWGFVHEFLSIFEPGTELPPRFAVYIDTMRQSLALEESEREMAKWMLERLEKIAVINGIAKIKVVWVEPTDDEKKRDPLKEGRYYGEVQEASVLGHQMYGADMSEHPSDYAYPRWVRMDEFHPAKLVLGHYIARAWVNYNHRRKRKAARGEAVIDRASEGLKADLLNGILKKVASLELSKPLPTLVFNVGFGYSKDGLQMQVYGIDPVDVQSARDFDWPEFLGYNEKQVEIINQGRKKYQKKIGEMLTARRRDQLITWLMDQELGLFDKWFFVDSPETDKQHRWLFLNLLYNEPKCKDVYQAARKIRKFVDEYHEELSLILDLADKIRTKAAELKAPLCIPELARDTENIVAFDEIFPIHLLSQINGTNKKLVPITGLSRSAGQIICLTGANNGGKTVTGQSVIDNLYLAQSGLPVLGYSFRFNVKSVIGSVFVAGSREGSTFYALLQKTKKVLVAIENIPGNQIVLVLDEVGTGTQEEAGYEFGKRVLTALAEKGASVLFITQITRLAEFAQDKLGAKCFKLDRKHCISSGIGQGEAESLIKQMGLNSLLPKL